MNEKVLLPVREIRGRKKLLRRRRSASSMGKAFERKRNLGGPVSLKITAHQRKKGPGP